MRNRPKILILNLYMVFPPNSGAKVVIFNRIVEFSKYFEVTFCCLNENESDFLAVEKLSRHAKVILIPYIPQKRSFLERLIKQFRNPSSTDLEHIFYDWVENPMLLSLVNDGCFDLIEIVSACWFHRTLLRSPAKFSVIALNHEAKYYTEKARACLAVFNLKGFIQATLDSFLVSIQERRASRNADIIITVFPPLDNQRFLAERRAGVPLLENSGGLDLKYYSDQVMPDVNLLGHGRPRLLFISTMFIESSVEAVITFSKEVLPLVRRKFPDTEFWIVGDHRNNRELNDLSNSDSSIKLFGLVKDTRIFLAAADLVVVPLLHGSGVRYKILEALAASKAVVTTAKGVEGLQFQCGEELIVTASIKDMIEPVLAVLSDLYLRKKLETNGNRAVFERYNSERLLGDLAKEYYKLLGISAGSKD